MPEIPNWFYRTSIKALILNEKREFLLVREEKWRELPWWWLDFWESPQEWIKRELQEEMWINVISVNQNPSYFLTCQKANWTRIANVIYDTKINIEDLKNFIPSDECLEIKFFNTQEAKKEKLFPNVEKFIEQYNKNS